MLEIYFQLCLDNQKKVFKNLKKSKNLRESIQAIKIIIYRLKNREINEFSIITKSKWGIGKTIFKK